MRSLRRLGVLILVEFLSIVPGFVGFGASLAIGTTYYVRLTGLMRRSGVVCAKKVGEHWPLQSLNKFMRNSY